MRNLWHLWTLASFTLSPYPVYPSPSPTTPSPVRVVSALLFEWQHGLHAPVPFRFSMGNQHRSGCNEEGHFGYVSQWCPLGNTHSGWAGFETVTVPYCSYEHLPIVVVENQSHPDMYKTKRRKRTSMMAWCQPKSRGEQTNHRYSCSDVNSTSQHEFLQGALNLVVEGCDPKFGWLNGKLDEHWKHFVNWWLLDGWINPNDPNVILNDWLCGSIATDRYVVLAAVHKIHPKPRPCISGSLTQTVLVHVLAHYIKMYYVNIIYSVYIYL